MGFFADVGPSESSNDLQHLSLTTAPVLEIAPSSSTPEAPQDRPDSTTISSETAPADAELQVTAAEPVTPPNNTSTASIVGTMTAEANARSKRRVHPKGTEPMIVNDSLGPQ